MRRSVFCPATLVQLVITLFLTQQCFGVTREFAQTYPLRSGGSLELNNVNGTVHIEAWDKDVVEVRAVKTTPKRNPTWIACRLMWTPSQMGGFPSPPAIRRKREWK